MNVEALRAEVVRIELAMLQTEQIEALRPRRNRALEMLREAEAAAVAEPERLTPGELWQLYCDYRVIGVVSEQVVQA